MDDLLARYAVAFESQDAAALSALFTDDATFMDSFGRLLQGRAAIAQQLQETFADPSKRARLTTTTLLTRPISTDHWLLHGSSEMYLPDGSTIPLRVTLIARELHGSMRIATLHTSLPVPLK